MSFLASVILIFSGFLGTSNSALAQEVTEPFSNPPTRDLEMETDDREDTPSSDGDEPGSEREDDESAGESEQHEDEDGDESPNEAGDVSSDPADQDEIDEVDAEPIAKLLSLEVEDTEAANLRMVLGQYPSAALGRGTTRIGGKDRYGTSIQVSKRLFPTGTKSRSVFIASGTAFPDGISLGALAAAEGAPLLLTTHNRLPPGVAAEIKRLKPEVLYIAGGSGAVSQAVQRQLQSLVPRVERLGGADRYETSLRIAEQFGKADEVMVATGTTFPDALVASAAVSKLKGGYGPVLLSRGFRASPELISALKKLKPSKVNIVGGTWSKTDLRKISEASGGSVALFSGKDRYATSAELAKHFYGASLGRVIYATGSIFADAMSGGPASKAFNAPILLTTRNCKPPAISKITASQSRVAILGGTGALAAGAASTTCSTLPPKVSIKSGYYRFSMQWAGQQTNYWCGPATGYMILNRLGHKRSTKGTALSQAALAGNAYMETNRYGRTAWAYNKFAVGMNRWLGKSLYTQRHSPNTAFFRDKVARSFTSTGRPVAVDTQEYAGGAHYNNHPRVTFSHIMPVEGYNPRTDTLLMLDSAAMYYYGYGSKNLFSHNLARFTPFLADFGIYY